MLFITPGKFIVCHLDATTFNTDFNGISEINTVGYFEGKQKRWLCDDKDLEMMYKVFISGSEILLWCERSLAKEPTGSTTGKHGPTKQERYEEVTDNFEDLKEKHKMEQPKLRLWARMIANGVHESYLMYLSVVPVYFTDTYFNIWNNTNVPMITGSAKTY